MHSNAQREGAGHAPAIRTVVCPGGQRSLAERATQPPPRNLQAHHPRSPPRRGVCLHCFVRAEQAPGSLAIRSSVSHWFSGTARFDLATAEASRPTLLLVHGAWHGPWCWEKLESALMSDGWTTRTVGLPSTGWSGPRPPSRSPACMRMCGWSAKRARHPSMRQGIVVAPPGHRTAMTARRNRNLGSGRCSLRTAHHRVDRRPEY